MPNSIAAGSTDVDSRERRVPSRRERLRVELTEEIIETGRRQLEEGGVANVSWRGIADQVGMNPASLYTYVSGINDLYTRILRHSFRSLADAIDAAARSCADCGPRTRILECARAYRRWAIERPHQFNLIFTNQIPGYVAPDDGEAFDAAMDVNRPFLEAIGELCGGRPGRVGPRSESSPELSDDQLKAAYGLRSMMHGFTSLEINQHSPYAAGSDDLMISALSRLIDATLCSTQ